MLDEGGWSMPRYGRLTCRKERYARLGGPQGRSKWL